MVRRMTEKRASDGPRQTHFGYRPVAEHEKTDLVRGVFGSVAGRYDLMNDLMSGGVHRLWKGAMIDWLAPRPGIRLVDVAGGTGDIAFRFLDRVIRRGHNGAAPARVTVCDLSPEMLEVGRSRSLARGLSGYIDWACCDAEALALPDGTMDVYTIAFGIRNVTRIERALAEAWRVLAPGGRFLCLEFSEITVPGLHRLYDAYSFGLIPRLGQWVAGDRDAYVYLVESIRRFPPQDEFADMIREAGFDNVKYRNLSGGIAALHSGWKL